MKHRIGIHKAKPCTGALDLSGMNDCPAGCRGFVQAKDGRLVFSDGTPARFVGFNFHGSANLPERGAAEKISRRLATMGVNVVRLHALDQFPFRARGGKDAPSLIDYPRGASLPFAAGTAGARQIAGTSRRIDEEARDRLEYWIYCLKRSGIYVHCDMLCYRAFLPGDGLDYGEPLFAIKSASHVNETLIRLQEEYIEGLVTHVNPYTGLSLVEDPCVMAFQIVNEDSVFFDVEGRRDSVGAAAYREETRRKFNDFLLSKYGSREALRDAWTFEGACALGDGEDPAEGTVRCVALGDYHQPMNDPMGPWDAPEGPARYADFCEFGIAVNRRYYGRLIEKLRSLGCRVPIATSCLLTGAADIDSHAQGSLMENNAYFNHPAPSPDRSATHVPHMREYVSADPLTQTYPGFEPRSNLTAQASCAALSGKPFVMTEWNEYGEYPFHSTAFAMTAAYAAYQEWDGLILYAYHHGTGADDAPEDEILNVMDAYNDPSLVLTFGFMSSVFRRGLVRPAEHRALLSFRREDLLTQPPAHRMPFSYFPFVMGIRSTYPDAGEAGADPPDVSMGAGFAGWHAPEGAKHAIVWSHSLWADAFRRERACPPGLRPGEDLVFPDAGGFGGEGGFRAFAQACDEALKAWNVLPEGAGLVGGALVSDTKELAFDPSWPYFEIRSDACPFFSGRPKETVSLGEGVSASFRADRVTAYCLPLDGDSVAGSDRILFGAVGATGMDGARYSTESDGFTTRMESGGKLYMETPQGALTVRGRARLTALDVYGNEAGNVPGVYDGKDTLFVLDGKLPCANFVIERDRAAERGK